MAYAALPKRQQGDFNNAAMIAILQENGPQRQPLSIAGWGNNTTGSLAIGTTSSNSVPIQRAMFDPNTTLPPVGSTITDCAFTNANLYVLFSNGWVYSAGDNTYGQLGRGDNLNRPYLGRIDYFVTNNLLVTKVWAAGSISNTNGGGCVYFGVTGGVYACGANAAGNLGNASSPTSNISTPAPCAGISQSITDAEISAVSGNFSTFMLGADGTVLVAGYNGQGQLGVGSTNNVTGSFTHALGSTGSNITNVLSISTTGGGGSGSALVLDSSGSVWTTGFNGYGQLGQGNTNNLSKFTKISSLSGCSAAGIGGGNAGYAYALSSTLYTWGYNGQNNLFQNNTTSPITTPSAAILTAPSLYPLQVIFPKEENLSTNAQLFAVVLNEATATYYLIYAGSDNGQNGVASSAFPGAFKYVPLSPYLNISYSNVFIHGTGTSQRVFVLGISMYAYGSNVDSVCTGGYCSNNMPPSVNGYPIGADIPEI